MNIEQKMFTTGAVTEGVSATIVALHEHGVEMPPVLFSVGATGCLFGAVFMLVSGMEMLTRRR
jgi:hypothetical protein